MDFDLTVLEAIVRSSLPSSAGNASSSSDRSAVVLGCHWFAFGWRSLGISGLAVAAVLPVLPYRCLAWRSCAVALGSLEIPLVLESVAVVVVRSACFEA